MVEKERIEADWVILDEWSVLIKGAKGRGEEILKETEKAIKESEAPDVRMDRVILSLVGLSYFFSKTKEREYLRVENKDLLRYSMYIGAREYGDNLDVQWYLVRKQPEKITEAIKALPKEIRRAVTGLNLFEHQDLIAYVTVVHRSLLEAVEKLMQSLNQDFSKIDRKSRGFLGVS